MLTSWMTGTSFGGTAPGHRSTSEACNDFCAASTRRGGWSGATRWSGSRGWRSVTKTSTSRCSVATPPASAPSGRGLPRLGELVRVTHAYARRAGRRAIACGSDRARRSALSPWEVDFVIAEERDGNWVWRHDPTVTTSLADLTWMDDAGVRFARPEVVLAHKAKWRQPKDDLDFDAAWPLLDPCESVASRDGNEDVSRPWLAAPDGLNLLMQ